MSPLHYWLPDYLAQSATWNGRGLGSRNLVWLRPPCVASAIRFIVTTVLSEVRRVLASSIERTAAAILAVPGLDIFNEYERWAASVHNREKLSVKA